MTTKEHIELGKKTMSQLSMLLIGLSLENAIMKLEPEFVAEKTKEVCGGKTIKTTAIEVLNSIEMNVDESISYEELIEKVEQAVKVVETVIMFEELTS